MRTASLARRVVVVAGVLMLLASVPPAHAAIPVVSNVVVTQIASTSQVRIACDVSNAAGDSVTVTCRALPTMASPTTCFP
jgi:hypothetical protein